MMCLLLAGIGQPLAMELYRIAPWVEPDNAAWAREMVRLLTLFGPVVVLTFLAIPRHREKSRPRDGFRFLAPFLALGLLFAPIMSWRIGLGIESNGPYRLAFLLQQILMVASWCCALREFAIPALSRYSRLVGLFCAIVGVGVCISANLAGQVWGVLVLDLTGAVELYNPYTETASQATAAGLAAATRLLVIGSVLGIAAGLLLDRLETPRARRVKARLLRVR